jgi:hypothetical protein
MAISSHAYRFSLGQQFSHLFRYCTLPPCRVLLNVLPRRTAQVTSNHRKRQFRPLPFHMRREPNLMQQPIYVSHHVVLQIISSRTMRWIPTLHENIHPRHVYAHVMFRRKWQHSVEKRRRPNSLDLCGAETIRCVDIAYKSDGMIVEVSDCDEPDRI